MKSSDYTRLKQRENKLWEFGGIAIPGGLSTIRAGVGGLVFVLVAGVAIIFGQLIKQPLATMAGLVIALIAGVIGYLLAGRTSPDKMTLPQRVAVFSDYAFAQPRRISGFSRDAEPDRIHWQAIVWEPRGADWKQTYNTFGRHYAAKADSLSSTHAASTATEPATNRQQKKSRPAKAVRR